MCVRDCVHVWICQCVSSLSCVSNQSNESGASSLSRLKRGAAITTVGLLLMLACSSVTSWTSTFSPKFIMVARNRSDPKPFKGKQDHFYSGTKPAGFSRLPHELFARNKHAGLYACKIFKKSHPKPSNLQEVKSHFVKARKLQHKVSSKVKNVKTFVFTAFIRGLNLDK